jgi:hypothetical protein
MPLEKKTKGSLEDPDLDWDALLPSERRAYENQLNGPISNGPFQLPDANASLPRYFGGNDFTHDPNEVNPLRNHFSSLPRMHHRDSESPSTDMFHSFGLR